MYSKLHSFVKYTLVEIIGGNIKMYAKNKTKILTMRISEEDYQELEKVSNLFGMSLSKYIRQMIQQNIITNRLAKTIVNNTSEEELKNIVNSLGIKQNEN